MRALIVGIFLAAACGKTSRAFDLGPSIDGAWGGSLSHPDATCTDGPPKVAFSTTTALQINQDRLGILLTWSDRCPVAANIPFALDADGNARQQGAAVTCIDSPTAHASMQDGLMILAGETLTLTINELEHDSGAQTRDCGYPLTAT